MAYSEDEMLLLSGIQHFAFCPRQWALIHIEQQWEDNRLTIEGKILHRHVDNSFYRQKMGDLICLRSVNLSSQQLGLYGVADIIELHQADAESIENAITHPSYPGYWIPYPVEYKHGKPKNEDIDIVQVTAQAICLEELYKIHISKGAVYYESVRRRIEIKIDETLRNAVEEYAQSMHRLFDLHTIPKAEKQSHCNRCSLIDICNPTMSNKATEYLQHELYEDIAL